MCGLSALLVFQTFIHVGVNTNLIPTTGMTLPFLSYGGSSLIGSAILAGIILNYTKTELTYMNKKIFALIAVGGTGGHVLPGCNLAEHLIENNYKVKLITDKRGQKFIQKSKKLNFSVFLHHHLIPKIFLQFFYHSS